MSNAFGFPKTSFILNILAILAILLGFSGLGGLANTNGETEIGACWVVNPL